jgi:hypothetical protein
MKKYHYFDSSIQLKKKKEHLFIYFLVDLGFELGASGLQNRQALYHLSHTSSPFCSGYFGYGSLELCPDWTRTTILLTLASQGARRLGDSSLSHQCPA